MNTVRINLDKIDELIWYQNFFSPTIKEDKKTIFMIWQNFFSNVCLTVYEINIFLLQHHAPSIIIHAPSIIMFKNSDDLEGKDIWTTKWVHWGCRLGLYWPPNLSVASMTWFLASAKTTIQRITTSQYEYLSIIRSISIKKKYTFSTSMLWKQFCRI
jgi:hypothetical protein